MSVHIQITLKSGAGFTVECDEKEAMEIFKGTKYIMENEGRASVEVKYAADNRQLLIDANEIAALSFPEDFFNKMETLE